MGIHRTLSSGDRALGGLVPNGAPGSGYNSAMNGTALAQHAEVRSAIDVLEAWVEAQRAQRELPGLSMAIVHDQTLLWAHGFGWADVDRKEPATAATLYRIGSITKLFTATAILILRDAGRLALDDPIARHL